MFRKMRRFKQQMPDEEAVQILENGSYGVLAVLGDDGYPYAVPMSYMYADGKILLHGAKAGHKMDAIKACDKVSFCVTSENNVVPEEYATYFRSVVAFGRIHIVDSVEEKRRLVGDIAGKYRPGFEEEREKAIDKEFPPLAVMVMEIEHMTGKESIELTLKRR